MEGCLHCQVLEQRDAASSFNHSTKCHDRVLRGSNYVKRSKSTTPAHSFFQKIKSLRNMEKRGVQ